MATKKVHLNIVFIGHVDHGKSTTVGRLLFDTKNIDEQAMKKLKSAHAKYMTQCMSMGIPSL